MIRVLGPLWLYVTQTGFIYVRKIVGNVLGLQRVLIQSIVVDKDFELVDALIATGWRHAMSTL